MAPLLLACTAPDRPVADPGPSTSTAPPTAPTTAPSIPPSPTTLPPTLEVPRIDLALAALCDDTGTPTTTAPEPPADGDLARVTLPGTRCNDGTPAVAWIRAGDPDAGDLLVFLEGGGACNSHASCAERWCAVRTFMSSADAGERRSANGVFDDAPWNAFADRPVVFAKYCSSDLWAGANADLVLHGDPAWPAYRIDFDGHAIVRSLLDVLEAGAVSDDGTVALPPLADLDRLVLSGSSAGAHGALYALDRAGERLAVDVVGILDGGLYPDPALLETSVAEAFEEALIQRWENDFVAHYAAVVDDGCTAQWGATEPWRCIDLYEVLRHQLATPYLLSIDHLNPANLDEFVSFGATTETFAAASAGSVEQLLAALPAVSAHATACGQHAVLAETPAFFASEVTDPGGIPWTLHDAADSWLAGTRVAANGTPDGATSDCVGQP